VIRFEHVDVTNWHNANRGMRNSFESWDAIDSHYDAAGRWVYGPNDWALACRLARAGKSHAKFRRQINVSVDIVAGNEFFKEFDTYKVGTTANSTSAMHRLGSRYLTMDDFSFDQPYHPDDVAAVADFNRIVQAWWDEGKPRGSATWRRMQKRLPMGFVYRRTVTLNYEVLRAMYNDRRNHRLSEWHEFCDWVRSLPYSSLITLEFDETKGAK
jgi:hypothetical protein